MHYELLCIIPAKYTDDELLPVKEKIREYITKSQGNVTFEDNLGKKKFAYPIQKAFQGYYLVYEFNANSDTVKKLGEDLKLYNEILRHLIIKKTRPSEMPLKQPAFVKKPEITLTPKKDEKDKIKLEDLDKKLDEILDEKNLI